ncbi:RUS family member 1 [Apodemus speciosus]|uniref:RUS family member 1 n=1 Tax=Apodemus speciosus TaxID=105296 RepID=A0ABQ0F0F5_APOSI
MAFASSLSGSLATQAVLQGLGVGNAKASVSAATSTWLVKANFKTPRLKPGYSTGMLGRIIFAWWKGLFADVLNDIAMFLELMAPMYPIFFTVTVSTSNLAKCIVGVAGGATRAALTMHQARRNNMADVSAKDSSQGYVLACRSSRCKDPEGRVSVVVGIWAGHFQVLVFLAQELDIRAHTDVHKKQDETVVNLAGLLVSLLMLPLVSDCPSLSLGCFILLTALHIYANYRAVRALVLETLNESRLQLVLKHFLQRGEVLEPASANEMEPLWTGVSELKQLSEGHHEPYLLCWDQARSECAGPSQSSFL